jgi:hypothetical protein
MGCRSSVLVVFFPDRLVVAPSAYVRGCAVTTKILLRVPGRDGAGDNMVEHVAGVDDFETAVATYWAAVR